MSYLHRSGDKRKSVEEYEYDDRNEELNMSPSSPGKAGQPMESEKRLRREIANSNERRRMQSINAGFESLKTLIPHHREEKLSKAAILQQTSEYISNLEAEKTRLLSQNNILRQTLKELNHNPDAIVGSLADQITLPPPPKRKKRDTESSDEGISLGFDEVQMDELKKEVVELRVALEKERSLRKTLEEKILPKHIVKAEVEPVVVAASPVAVAAAAVSAVVSTPAAPTVAPLPPTAPQAPVTPPAAVHPAVHPTVHPAVHPAPPPPAEITDRVKQEKSPVRRASVEPVQTKLDHCPVLPQSLPPAPRVPVFNSSMSKRNLDTIVEAIRHLEGDHVMSGGRFRGSSLCVPPPPAPIAHHHHHHHHIPHSHSEESQVESSSSDAEDMKSESSGRDSPPLCHPAPSSSVVSPAPPAAVTVVTTAPLISPAQWALHQALVSRTPGVIVQQQQQLQKSA